MTEILRLLDATVWWVDEQGAWHAADARYARRFPDCATPNITQHQSPMFTHLGMVKVARLAGVLDIQWDIREASEEALRSVFHFLLTYETPGARTSAVALRYFFGAWNSEGYANAGDALDRMADISVCERFEPIESITIANVSLDHGLESTPMIQEAYQIWRACGGNQSGAAAHDLERIQRRAFSMRPDAKFDNFIITQVGRDSLATALLGGDWPRLAIGMSPQKCHSDDAFEDEMCRDYPVVMKSGVPKLDHVRAFVQLENQDPIWLNYERLLLPWKSRNGSPTLMCCAEPSQNLQIDFLDTAIG